MVVQTNYMALYQAAKKLNRGKDAIRQLIAAGRINAIKANGRWKIEIASIEAYKAAEHKASMAEMREEILKPAQRLAATGTDGFNYRRITDGIDSRYWL